MKDFLGFICIVFAGMNLFKQSFGFLPLNDSEAWGYNLGITFWYVGSIYVIYRFIKNRKLAKQHGTQ